MGKVKLLLDVIEDIRSLADSLETVAAAMCHSDSPDTKAEVPKSPTPMTMKNHITSCPSSGCRRKRFHFV